MSTHNLDLIRFLLDGAIVFCCLVLIVGIWRQSRRSLRNGGAEAGTPPTGRKPGSLPTHLAPRFPGGRNAEPLSPLAAAKAEVQRLTRLGLNVSEIARRTGLAKSEVALIQKFPPQIEGLPQK